MRGKALLIGNSDGVGLATTTELLKLVFMLRMCGSGLLTPKMAKGEVKPFMMGVDRAAQHLLSCIEKKPVRYTAPWIVIPLVKFRSWMLGLSIL